MLRKEIDKARKLSGKKTHIFLFIGKPLFIVGESAFIDCKKAFRLLLKIFTSYNLRSQTAIGDNSETKKKTTGESY
jgi:hypothetical protein